MRKFFLIIYMGFSANCLVGQQRPSEGWWTAIVLPVKFSSHWQWHNDAGYRTLGNSIRPLQYLYRTGARYTMNEHWSAAAGVAFFFTKTDFVPSHHEFGKEFRFWEEAACQHPLYKSLSALFRVRAEQRFFAATNLKNKYTGYRFRIRPGLNQRINNKWSLQLTDEYMRQIANNKFSFDQNRLTVSGIYQLKKSTQLQAGYMWLKWPTTDQHILSFTFTKTISVHGN